jgi:opacity protein-like surface antigen
MLTFRGSRLDSQTNAANGPKRLFFGAPVFVVGLLTASGAWAQCAGSITGPGIVKPQGQAYSGAVGSLGAALDTLNTSFLGQGDAFVTSPSSQQANFTAGGAWARGIGGELETKSVTIITSSGNAGSIICNTTIRETYGGIQVGQDVATVNLNGSGANIHFGFTGGYLQSNSHDLNGYTTSNGMDASFVGGYATLIMGNWYADLLYRRDFYQVSETLGSLGIFNQGLAGTGFAYGASLGYKADLASGWFIEPSAGIIVSRSAFDNFNTQFQGPIPFGQVAFTDIESTLGRAGLRIGTSLAAGEWAIEPFVALSAWHEFAGASRTSAYFPFVLESANTSTSRIGTYGQYGIGFTSQLANSGWLGYARLDYRNGENVEGLGINAGLRYQFNPTNHMTPSSVIVKAPPSVLSQPYSWSGLYIGGTIGTAFGQTTTFVPAQIGSLFSQMNEQALVNSSGILGGIEAGYNYQTGSWLLGIESDVAWTNLRGSKFCFTFGVAASDSCSVDRSSPVATVTGRFGYAWDRVLAYVKGGGAWTDGSFSINYIPTGAGTSYSDSMFGWTVGGGLEFGLTPRWSVKAEYDYLDFGSRTQAVGAVLGPFAVPVVRTAENLSEVKFGLNYRFAQDPGASSSTIMPLKTPKLVTPSPAAMEKWTGCYIGAAAGYSLGRTHADSDGTDLNPFTNAIPVTGNFDADGGIVGGTVGCNLFQSKNWVFGVEGDFSWTNIKGSTRDLPPFDTNAVNKINQSWLNTDRIRIGYGLNNTLVFVTGGVANTRVTNSVDDPVVPFPFPPPVTTPFFAAETHVLVGWSLGAGAEMPLNSRWSVKAEYLHAQFGGAYLQQSTNFLSAGNRNGDVFLSDNIFRGGINYKFGSLIQ